MAPRAKALRHAPGRTRAAVDEAPLSGEPVVRGLGLTVEFAGGAPVRRTALLGHAAQVVAFEAVGDGDGRCGQRAMNAISPDVAMGPEADQPFRAGSRLEVRHQLPGANGRQPVTMAPSRPRSMAIPSSSHG